jgi:hypothetical protein
MPDKLVEIAVKRTDLLLLRPIRIKTAVDLMHEPIRLQLFGATPLGSMFIEISHAWEPYIIPGKTSMAKARGLCKPLACPRQCLVPRTVFAPSRSRSVAARRAHAAPGQPRQNQRLPPGNKIVDRRAPPGSHNDPLSCPPLPGHDAANPARTPPARVLLSTEQEWGHDRTDLARMGATGTGR